MSRACGAQAPRRAPPGGPPENQVAKCVYTPPEPRKGVYRDQNLNFFRSTMGKEPKQKKTPPANSKRGLIFSPAKGEFEKTGFQFFPAYGEQKRPQQLLGIAGQKNPLPQMRVALRATRPSAAVAENGPYHQNVGPAQSATATFIPGTWYQVVL